MNLIRSCIDAFKLGIILTMGPKNSACKSGLAVESGVVESGKINIAKVCKNLGPRYPGC